MNNEKTTALKLRSRKNAALRFLALTSFFVTYPYGQKIAMPLAGADLAPWVAAVAAYMIFLFIDVPLSNGLDYIEESSAKGRVRWRFWKNSFQWRRAITGAMVVFTLLITGGMSYLANYLVADVVAPVPEVTELQENRMQNQAAYSATTDELKADIWKAEKELKAAPREGHRMVETAIKSGPDKWQEHYRNRNGWFMKQRGKIRAYVGRIEKAKQDSAALSAGRSEYLASLRGEKVKHLSAADSVNAVIDAAFIGKLKRSEGLFSGFWKFLLGLDLAAVLVVIFCHWWLISYFRDGGTLPAPKNSFAEAMAEWQNRTWDAIVERLFRRQETDGTPDEKPTEATPTEVSRYAPVRGEQHDDIPVGRVLRLIEAQSEQLQALSNVVTDLKSRTEQRPKDEKASEKKPTENRRKTRRKKATKPDGKRQCLECKADISHRTKRAKFCCDAHRKNWNEKHATATA